MRSLCGRLVVLALAALSGCGLVPPLPSETELPVGEIITAAVCQLRDALYSVEQARSVKTGDAKFGGFDPRQWAVSITLTPKNTLWMGAGFAGSYKSNPASLKNVESFTASLAGLLSVPAANVESAGYSQSVMTYTLRTAVLFDENFEPRLNQICKGPPSASAQCVDRRDDKPSPYALSHDLMICEWLFRALAPVDGDILSIASPNANTFSYTVSISMNAGAGASAGYVVPNATWFVGASAGGREQKEVSLAFGLTQDSKAAVKTVVRKGAGEPKSTTAKPAAAQGQPKAQEQLVPSIDSRSISNDALQRLNNIQTFSVPGVNDRTPLR